MEYRILGPLAVSDQGRSLPLGGTRQRALLAALLLARNEPVSSDRLLEDVWHAERPASGAKALQVQMSALRKTLGGNGLIETTGSGYRLSVPEGALDVDRFEALLAEGRGALVPDPARGSALLREALELWRGPALADLAYEPFAQAEIARLEERRLVCLEERIEADLALGRHVDLVGELEGLVARHPLRERLRAQLMLALYRSGRQAEALDVYQRTRRTFVEEIGLEPSPMLQELERRILNHDAALAPPVPPQRPPSGVWGRLRRRPGLVVAAGVLVLAGAGAALALELSRDGTRALSSVAGNAVGVVDSRSGDIVAEIPVGNAPTAVAAGDGAVWVLNADDRTITRIDAETKEARTFATGSTPLDIAVGNGAVWVANGQPDESAQFLGPVLTSVAKVDPSTNTVRATIPLAPRRSSSFVAHGRTRLALTAGAVWAVLPDASVARIDARSGRVVATVDGVAALEIVGDGKAVWVADTDGTIERISPRTNAVTARVRLDASGIDALALGGGAVWAASAIDGVVWRIDAGAQVVARPIQVRRGVGGLAFGAGALWAVNPLRGTVTRIDPERNEPVETIRIGNTPGQAAVVSGDLWVTVQGSSGAAAAAPSGDVGIRALPSSFCGPVYAGTETPDVLIASDFPLQGGLRFSTVQMEEAVAFVLRRHDFRAGRFDVAYQSCDDSLASTGIFDVAKCESNAKAYAANQLVVGVVGTVNSGCAVAQIPILNEAAGGPLAMVSPLNSLPELTRPPPGESPAEWLASLYPTGARNYARVYPTDDYQGAALALVAQRLGARRVALARDREDFYAELLAGSFRTAAERLGLEVVADEEWDPRARSYGRLAREVAAGGPDAVFLGGLLDDNGAQVVVDLRAALGDDVPVLVSDGFTPLPLFSEQAGAAAEGVYASLLGLPAPEQAGDALPREAREFLAAFGRTQPAGVEPSALFAAQAAEVLLDAIARSDGTRASVVEELLATEVEDGILGSFRFDENGDTTLNPVSVYRVTGGGGANEILGTEGGELYEVVTPPPELVR